MESNVNRKAMNDSGSMHKLEEGGVSLVSVMRWMMDDSLENRYDRESPAWLNKKGTE